VVQWLKTISYSQDLNKSVVNDEGIMPNCSHIPPPYR